MKCILIIFLFLFLVGVNFGNDGDLSLEATESQISPYGYFTQTFVLKNASSSAVYYSGYSLSSPIWIIQLNEDEKWKVQNGMWCGTGLEEQELSANKSLSFTVPSQALNKDWKLGIKLYYLDKSSKKRVDITVWSSVIKFQSPVKDDPNLKSVADSVKLTVVWNDKENFPYKFKLSNISKDKTFYFAGYDVKDNPPLYNGQDFIKNKWVDTGQADWNGVGKGIEFLELRPDSSIEFSVPAQSLDRAWRIGIRLYSKKTPKVTDDCFQTLWGPELPKRHTVPDKRYWLLELNKAK